MMGIVACDKLRAGTRRGRFGGGMPAAPVLILGRRASALTGAAIVLVGFLLLTAVSRTVLSHR